MTEEAVRKLSRSPQAEEFRGKGCTVHLTVKKGESHVLSTLVGTRSVRLYDQIEQSRQGCGK